MATYFIRVTWSFNSLLTSLISLYLHVLYTGEIHQDSRLFQLACYDIQQNEFYQQTNNTLFKLHLKCELKKCPRASRAKIKQQNRSSQNVRSFRFAYKNKRKLELENKLSRWDQIDELTQSDHYLLRVTRLSKIKRFVQTIQRINRKRKNTHLLSRCNCDGLQFDSCQILRQCLRTLGPVASGSF